MRHHVQVASPLRPLPPAVTVLHSVWISSVEVKAGDRRRRIDVQFPGHPVQVGQPQVDAAHGQHAGLEQVDVAVIVAGNLTETGRKVAAISSPQTSHHKGERERKKVSRRTLPSTAMGGWYSSVCHSPKRGRSLSSFVSDIILALRERLEKPLTIWKKTHTHTHAEECCTASAKSYRLPLWYGKRRATTLIDNFPGGNVKKEWMQRPVNRVGYGWALFSADRHQSSTWTILGLNGILGNWLAY